MFFTHETPGASYWKSPNALWSEDSPTTMSVQRVIKMSLLTKEQSPSFKEHLLPQLLDIPLTGVLPLRNFDSRSTWLRLAGW